MGSIKYINQEIQMYYLGGHWNSYTGWSDKHK